MAREIKFRGYDTDSKVWRYGYYFLKEDTTLSPIYNSKEQYEKDKKANEHHLILFNGFSDWNLPKTHYQSEVDGDSIGQYTGLRDDNKKEIYEGDIVKCVDINSGSEFVAVVEFGNPNGEYSWGWQLRHIKGDKPNLDILLWIDMEESGASCAVIGNIYENPELLNPADSEVSQ